MRLPGRLIVLGASLLALVLAPTTAAAASADDVAISYARTHAGKLGVTPADVAGLNVTSSYRSGQSSVTHVNLNQFYDGLEVFGGAATVSVLDGSVVFASGAFVKGLTLAGGATANLGPTEAVDAAADGLGLEEPENLRVLSMSVGAAQESLVSDGGISDVAIPARLGWQPTADGLRLAWQLSIDDSSDIHHWNATVDAKTGALLDKDDWTISEDIEDLGTTLDRGVAASAVASALLAGSPDPVNDGSSYRVFAIPTESPNDAGRVLVQNPADAATSPFGWHDTNGVAGAEFTITRGNNVHAYMDQDDNNQIDFNSNPDGGPGLDFDFEADLTQHAQNYRNAAVTNLFYWNNVIHDLAKRYGFDEPADNFQAINYNGVGSNGDYVRAEAADGDGTNNANFNTPASGGSPRMQMFLWPGNQFGAQNQVVVDGVASFDASWSRFGPAPTPAGLAGTLVYGGTGCTAAMYPATLPSGNWIAVVDGGTAACSYLQRVQVADSLGGDAVVVAHNAAGNAPILTANLSGPTPNIPAIAVTQANGAAIKAAIGPSTTGSVRKHPNHPGIRDGDFESGIILHEYTHGISNRLTGGPGKPSNCLSGNEQAGEGWSDYIAITTLLDPALDDPDQPRGMGPYALFQANRHGNGIRPRPYTRDMSIQPFTYDSIKTGGWLNGTSLALPHGLGHGWAATLWDLDWELIDKYGFNANVYGAWDTGGNNRALQYVMDGLKMQGCGPGLVVASRAVITAANIRGGGGAGENKGDACTAWAVFARRGLGFSAVQGTTNRNDNSEAFDTHPDCRRGFLAPASHAYGTLRTVIAGDAVPLRWNAPELTGTNVLSAHNPYSRLVDCATLQTVDASSPFITPRPIPVPTETPGNSGLTRSATGQYHYNWATLAGWAGTCREVVVTRKDGLQHRAFFRFVAS